MNRPALDILVGQTPQKWQMDFVADCARAGFDAHGVVVAAPSSTLPGLALLLEIERLAFRTRDCALDAAAVHPAPRRKGALAVDLTGGAAPEAEGPVLRPLYDGDPSLAAVCAALLDGSAPLLTVEARIEGKSPIPLHCGRLAVPDFSVFSRAATTFFSRMRTVLLKAVRDLDRGAAPVAVEPARCAEAAPSPLLFAAQSLSGKIANRLKKLLVTPDHWRVAWRPLRNDATISHLCWPDAAWTILPDDGARYYADPFLFEKDGETHLFVEEYPYATQKAILCWTRLRPDGTADRPRPILETAHHLSYPFVFAHGGDVFMIPECCGSGQISLYRARKFPHDWVLDTVLVDGVQAADATLVRHDGRFWLFAALSEPGSSSWDTLLLFHADDLRGPFRPHAQNPAVIDARWARPAGAMSFTAQGALLRVAQDCQRAYGDGVTICEVTRLDADDYAQEKLTQLGPPPILNAQGVHTLNTGGGREVIDFRAPLTKFGR